MSINKDQLRKYVVQPTLEYLGLWSAAAENLLMGTAAQESGLGTYIHQLGSGPALGIYQMEPFTRIDIELNYLCYKRDLYKKVTNLVGVHFNDDSDGVPWSDSETMIGNLYYATAMARVHYLRVKEALPSADDIDGLARYWKQYYNTRLGKGTEQEFIENYHKYVA